MVWCMISCCWGGFDTRIMMVERLFWLVCQQFLAVCSQKLLGVTPTKNHTYEITANVMTSPGVMGRSWHCIFTQEYTRIMRIYCRGDRIGDIELKGGMLDFGKSARLVCQPTQRHLCLLPKKIWLWTHKKKNFLWLHPLLAVPAISAPSERIQSRHW